MLAASDPGDPDSRRRDRSGNRRTRHVTILDALGAPFELGHAAGRPGRDRGDGDPLPRRRWTASGAPGWR